MQAPVPTQQTRTVVRNLFRELIALATVVLVLVLFVAMHVQESPVTVTPGELVASLINLISLLFIMSAGVLVWGNAIERGFALLQKLREGQG